jgi:ATP-dependent RNA helicase RhlE
MENQSQGFYGLGIAPQLLATLDRLQFRVPTPIQEKSIPLAIEGKDIVGIAQTGTGKTLAFGIPIIQRLAQTQGIALIVLPTRELAAQVQETLNKLSASSRLQTVLLIGGLSMEQQVRGLRLQPRVIIGTPGRINDHLQRGTLRLNNTNILVLDEADRMFDMGFAPQIKKILQLLPRERQTMLFSATMPPEIMRMATQFMKSPLQIEIARAGTASETIEQELYMVSREDKTRLLESLLTQYKGSVLIFSRTKHGARKICRAIRDMGHKAAEIHSDRTFGQRKQALEGFKSGMYRALVATDIAARGIHISDIELVINYDVPEHAEDYVHRIGRTGRAGATGRAITFASRDQAREVRDIQKLIQTWIPIAKLPELPPARVVAPMPPGSYPQAGGQGAPYAPRYQQRSRPPFRRRTSR